MNMAKMLNGTSTVEVSKLGQGDGATIFDYMRLRAADSRYLSNEDEWKIIDSAVFQLGLRPIDAKSYLVGAAICDGFSTECLVKRMLSDMAGGLRKRSEKISRQKFEFMVEAALGLTHGEISREEAEDLVKAACDSASLKARRNGLLRSRRWYHQAGSSKQKQQQSV
jgi:hypothetical protein